MSYDRRAIMTAAWNRYRAAYRNYRSQPAASPVAAPGLSPMEARIDALKFLPFRYYLAAAERAICAEYAS